jgi:hypothetical protein
VISFYFRTIFRGERLIVAVRSLSPKAHDVDILTMRRAKDALKRLQADAASLEKVMDGAMRAGDDALVQYIRPFVEARASMAAELFSAIEGPGL